MKLLQVRVQYLCKACDGSGERPFPDSAPVSNSVRLCPACRGAGQIEEWLPVEALYESLFAVHVLRLREEGAIPTPPEAASKQKPRFGKTAGGTL